MYLEPPTTNEIINCIGSLKVNKAVGHDNIPAYFLKIAAPTLAPYLRSFFDFVFTHRIFPNICKIAKIVPIHKKGEKDNPNNFRPISILNCFSKILEKMIHQRILPFLNKHKILTQQQYGFQKNLSTMHEVLNFTTATYDNTKDSTYMGILFLDLTKAFDTVCHQILLGKLEHYGIHGPCLQLLNSFLNKKQFVSLHGVNSELQSNTFGVPQGSLLGPLLFLHYVNDLPNAVLGTPTLFADDTCLMLKHSNLSTLQSNLNYQASCLIDWCKSNKLTINPQKSHVLLIPPKLNKTSTNFVVKLDDTFIKAENCVKYLDILTDSHLNFRFHLEEIENKLSKSLGILYKLKPILPQNPLFKSYYSMVHSHLLYGLVVWGSTFPSYLKQLNSIQNKPVKLIGGRNYSKLNILKLPDLYKLETAKFVYRFMHKTLPQTFFDFFVEASKISGRTTRSSGNRHSLYIPRYNTNRLQRSIKYQGVKIWSSILGCNTPTNLPSG